MKQRRREQIEEEKLLADRDCWRHVALRHHINLMEENNNNSITIIL
jgi:hypothetical protein